MNTTVYQKGTEEMKRMVNFHSLYSKARPLGHVVHFTDNNADGGWERNQSRYQREKSKEGSVLRELSNISSQLMGAP